MRRGLPAVPRLSLQPLEKCVEARGMGLGGVGVEIDDHSRFGGEGLPSAPAGREGGSLAGLEGVTASLAAAVRSPGP